MTNLDREIPCVVANGNNPVALTVIRALGRRGIPVMTLLGDHTPNRLWHSIIGTSRYITRRVLFDERDYENNLVQALLELGKESGKRIPLIPLSDRDMEIISLHRDVLLDFYALPLPSHEIIQLLLNKDQFYHYAQKNGLPIPRTIFPDTSADLVRQADQLRYPCIIKPRWRDNAWIARFGSQKIIECDSPDALGKLLSGVTESNWHCVVQEVIPGDEDNLYCSFAIVDDASHPNCVCVCRKIRQFPPFFGNTAMAETVREDRIQSLTEEICRKVGIVGYVSIEFKYDSRDDIFRIIEVTPARLNRQGGIADAAGLPFIKSWYDACLGQTPTTKLDYRLHVKWISEINELRSFMFYIRRGVWSVRDWLASYRNTRGFELFARDDWSPILSILPTISAVCLRTVLQLFTRPIR